MIDLHILILGNENQTWLEQCLQSLENEPVNLRMCQGIPGDLSQARSLALKQGTSEYVGWVDPDDYIIPGAYARLLTLVGDKSFVWGKEQIIEYDDSMNIVRQAVLKTPHHIHIVHRDVIDYSYLESRKMDYPDRWISRLTSGGVFDDTIGYVWRKYPSSPCMLHRKNNRNV